MHMLYSNRAACYARLGRHADALADARACVALAPGVCRGHWQEALALEAQGRYAEALEAYERACRVAREQGADPNLQREYEARRESLRRTTARRRCCPSMSSSRSLNASPWCVATQAPARMSRA
jgi:tetratricopeptide (TPR) repeat protein